MRRLDEHLKSSLQLCEVGTIFSSTLSMMLLAECLCPFKIPVSEADLQRDGIWRWRLWWGEITAFIKEAQRTPLPFHQVRTHEKMVIHEPESRRSPDTKSADALLLDSPGPSESQSVSCSVVSDFATPWTLALQAPLSMESSGTTALGCHSRLQGTFPTQGSNPGLPHCRYILYCSSHQGSQALELCEI